MSVKDGSDDELWRRWTSLVLLSVLCCSAVVVSFLSGMLAIYRQVLNRQVTSSQRPRTNRQTPASIGIAGNIPAPLDYTRQSPAAIGSFRLPSTSGHRLLWSVSESVRDLERGQAAETLDRVPKAWNWVPINETGPFRTKRLPQFWNEHENKFSNYK